jgi:hypothetical protein
MKIVGVLDLVDKGSSKINKVLGMGEKFAGLFKKASNNADQELSKVMRKLDEVDKKASSGFLGGGVSKIAGAAAGLFAVDQVLSFGKGIFTITAEMQKYEAVLTNTFGSQERAKSSMKDITDFAAKTPFQINQLTDSYIKLANRGFVPTMEEMTKMGDLASSTAKPFDQLVEAILDAQTGEFERLKQFGIKAHKEGNRVAFAFKGQTTEVENSEEAIKQYLLSLGDMQGVSGSMAAISKTLEGQLSNMFDNLDQLKVKIGQNIAEGFSIGFKVANKAIDTVSSFVDFVTDNTSQLSNIFAPFERSFAPVKAQLERLNKLLFEGADATSFFERSFNFLGNVFLEIEPILEGVGKVLSSLYDTLIRVVSAVADFWKNNEKLQKVVAGTVGAITGVFSAFFDFIAKGFEGIGDLIEGVFSMDFQKIKQGLSKTWDIGGLAKDILDKSVQGALKGYEKGFSAIDFFADKQAPAGSVFGDGSQGATAQSNAATNAATTAGINGVTGGGSKPTNIYINIDKLNESIQITTQELSESVGEIEQKMIDTLLRVVNSANQVYG